MQISSETLLDIRAERARRSLSEYTRQAWPQTEPGEFSSGWCIDAVAAHLEAITNGQIKRLLINIPPRHMKSLSVSVFWPTWEWLDHPELKYMYASYSAELSTRDNVKSRDIIQSPWYQQTLQRLYPNPDDRWRLKGDQNVKMRYENSRGGHRIATSVTGNATGDGGDRIVADDPHNVREGDSDIKREAVLTWWDRTMSSRLNNRATGVKVIVMQRVHEKDLSGHVLAESGDYVHLCLPMEYVPRVQISGADLDGQAAIDEANDVFSRNKLLSAPSPIGWSDPRTTDGEILWPARFRPEDVEELKKSLGSYAYAGQYGQRPSPEGGGMLKRGWWRYFKKVPDRFDELLISGDLSFKDSDGSSYVVFQYHGRVGEDMYVLDQVRDRMDFPTTVQAFKNFVAKHPRAKAKLIEDKANGPAVIASLRNVIPGIIPVLPDGSKIARVSAISPFVESGNVHIPDPTIFPNAIWVHDFVDECAIFPNGDFDDQVDAFSQGANRIFNTPRPKVVTLQQLKDIQARSGQ